MWLINYINTIHKKTNLPSFEYQQWNPQDIAKIVNRSYNDDDDLDYDKILKERVNKPYDIDIDNLSD